MLKKPAFEVFLTFILMRKMLKKPAFEVFLTFILMHLH